MNASFLNNSVDSTNRVLYNNKLLSPSFSAKLVSGKVVSTSGIRDIPKPNIGVQMISRTILKDLMKHGIYSMINFQRTLLSLDNGFRSVSLNSWKKALREYTIDLSDNEMRTFFEFLDPEDSLIVPISNVMDLVRCPMTNDRKKLVLTAFASIDNDNDGIANPANLIAAFDAMNHPDVISGSKTSDNILKEFLDTFDVGGEVDGKITREEFLNYYANISAMITDDYYFESMIRNLWHVDINVPSVIDNRPSFNPPQSTVTVPAQLFKDLAWSKQSEISKFKYGQCSAPAGVLPGTSQSTVDILADRELASRRPNYKRSAIPEPSIAIRSYIARIRLDLMKHGILGYIGLQRQFLADDKGYHTLSLHGFKSALKACSVDLTDAEIRRLFEYFDADNMTSELINISDVMNVLRVPCSQQRLQLIHKAYDTLDSENLGFVDAEMLAYKYDAASHPDVLSGRATTASILKQFLDTFDVGGEVEGKVTRNEFLNYYANIGAAMNEDDKDDQIFEKIIRQVWHVDYEPIENHRNDGNRQIISKEPYMKDNEHRGGVSNVDISSINFPIQTINDHSPSTLLATDHPVSAGGAYSLRHLQELPQSKVILLLLAKLRSYLLQQGGAYSYISLQRKLNQRSQLNERIGERIIDFQSFQQVLLESNIPLSIEEIPILFNHLKKSSQDSTESEIETETDNASLLVSEIMEQLRGGPLKVSTQELLHRAFDQLDRHHHSGVVDAVLLMKCYDVAEHPDVRSGRVSAHQALEEFLDTFDVGGEVEGKVTRNEFLNYYANIGAAMNEEEEDQTFEKMIRQVWHVHSYNNNTGTSTATATGTAREMNDVTTRKENVNNNNNNNNNLHEGRNDHPSHESNNISNDTTTARLVPSSEISQLQRGRDPVSNYETTTTTTTSVTSEVVVNDRAGIRPTRSQDTTLDQDLLYRPNRKQSNRNLFSSSIVLGDDGVNARKKTNIFIKRNPQRLDSHFTGAVVAVSKGDWNRQDRGTVEATEEDERVAAIIVKITTQLKLQGIRGCVNLNRALRDVDDDSSRSLSIGQFKKALANSSLKLSDQGEQSIRRKDFINSVFTKLDTYRTGSVDPGELIRSFDAANHPEVVSGTRTSEEVLQEFLDTFDVGGEVEGKVTRNEFLNYYANIGATMNEEEEDQTFEKIIRQVWHVKGGQANIKQSFHTEGSSSSSSGATGDSLKTSVVRLLTSRSRIALEVPAVSRQAFRSQFTIE